MPELSSDVFKRTGRVIAFTLAAFLILIALGAVWVGVRGAFAYQHLSRVQSGAAASVAAFSSDPSSTETRVASLAADASAARDLTSDPIWSLSEQVPWVGPQLAAFRVLASSADSLFGKGLLPLATAAQGISIDGLRPVSGRIDASSLISIVEPATVAAEQAAASASALQGIDRTPLLAAVATPLDRAEDLLTEAAAALDALSKTSRILPGMLGGGGARNYLVLVQNNAEWRSLGGITGTAILLRADRGAVSLVETQSAGAILRDQKDPIVALPPELVDVYGTRPARYFNNLTQIPDFTVDGPLAREMYVRKTGVDVDGVIALDPVVLSYVLQVTGPVGLPDGSVLSANDAPHALMNQVYARFPDPSAQDAYFSQATKAVFDALLTGRGTTSGFVSALTRASSEHRLLYWSADATEQAVIAGSTLAGGLPVTDSRTARFGVYLNDGTGSKMSYYVKPDVSLGWGSCGPAGAGSSRQLTLTLTLTNLAPLDAATSLPTYITGNGAYGSAPGSATVVTNIYLPEGFDLVSGTASDEATFADGSVQGRRVVTFGSRLDPQVGVTIKIAARAVTSASEAEAYVTPTADPSLSTVVAAECRNAAVAVLR